MTSAYKIKSRNIRPRKQNWNI